MKDGVVILNFSRDTLVNDDDMAEALDAGKVRYYVSDFPQSKGCKHGEGHPASPFGRFHKGSPRTTAR